ncbi:MAG: co-chaperone GroES, partial [bacterium]
MKIKPLGDRILGQRVEEADSKKGGIIIPDTAKEKPMQAKIIEVGSGRKDESGKVVPLEVKKGDMVLIGKYAGTD